MPWTLSHPAILLPLRRFTPRPLDFTALVIGSMTPDFGYYIGRFDLATFAHTLPGSLIACLPVGMLLLLLFYLVCRPVCHALPSPHRQNLRPLCPKFPNNLMQWAMILISLLLGAWTHNFWDAFTHQHGWFVDRIPWLQQPVIYVGSTTVYRFLLFQELSTVIGFAVIVTAYCLWLRSRPLLPTSAPGAERWRYLFWLAIFGLSLVATLPAAVHYAHAASLHELLFVRSVLFRTAIYSPLVAVPLTLLASGLIYSRRED